MTSGASPTWTSFLLIAGVLLAGDYIWLGHIARPMYDSLRQALNPGRSPGALPFRVLSAVGAYALMTLTLGWLVIPQVVGRMWQERLLQAAWWGGLWGLAVYGVYDFTSYAIIDAFPLVTALVDMFWGVLIGIFTAFVVGTFAPAR